MAVGRSRSGARIGVRSGTASGATARGADGGSAGPSTSDCATIFGRVGAPTWVRVTTSDFTSAWMASYYIDNRTNWIDGVRTC